MGPGYKEDRGFVATLLDPFDIYGMIKGRDNATRFWDEQPGQGSGHKLPPVSRPSGEEGLRV